MTIDLTGGTGGLVVAASKILSQKSKSSTTGVVSELGQGYGSQTGMDVAWQFTENKFSPMFGVIRDFAEGKTFEGGKPTILGEAKNLVTPIIVKNISQFKTEPATMQLIGLIADGLGFGANVYVPSTDWGENTGEELTQFKEKVGEAKFKEANDKYNQQYGDWLKGVKINQEFNKLTDEEKQKVITNKKAEIKKNMFILYDFKYKTTPVKKLLKF